MEIKLQIAIAKKLMLMINNNEDALFPGTYENNVVIIDTKNRNRYFYIKYVATTNRATVKLYVTNQLIEEYDVIPNLAEFGDYKIPGVLKVTKKSGEVLRCYILPYFVTINEYVRKTLENKL